MYPPTLFANQDLDQALEIASQIRFAQIALMDGELCEVIFAPLLVDTSGGNLALLGHLSRTNPLLALLAAAPRRARVVFSAADGYVSPSVYAEKALSGRVVPTWNYVTCQFAGTLEKLDDDALPALLKKQVAEFERAAGTDWTLDDAPPEFRAGMIAAIFGIRLHPQGWRVHKKLSQNRPADLAALADWFAGPERPHRSIRYWLTREG